MVARKGCVVKAVVAISLVISVGCVAPPRPLAQGGVPIGMPDGLIFSSVQAGLDPAQLWINRPVLPNKQLTQYSFVEGASVGAPGKVLRATADQSASLLLKKFSTPVAPAHIRWSWRVDQLNGQAKTADPRLEDSPVRIVLAFAPPHAKALAALPFQDQLFLQSARLMHREEPPYATLMYVWSNDLPVGTVLSSAHTGRVRMVVAESGAARTGQWLAYSRDIAADYQAAYGYAPGAVLGVALLSDTDNTRATTTAYYADVELFKPKTTE